MPDKPLEIFKLMCLPTAYGWRHEHKMRGGRGGGVGGGGGGGVGGGHVANSPLVCLIVLKSMLVALAS